MKKVRIADKRVRNWYELLPWLFMAVALPVVYAVWNGERTAEFNVQKNEFEYQLNETSNQLVNQLRLFEQSLYAIRGLFDASEFVSETEFNAFAIEVLNSKFSSGLHEIGFAKLVNPAQPDTYHFVEPKLKTVIMRLNAQPKSLHAPVIYTVTHQEQPQKHQLFDAFENKNVRKSMEFTALHDDIIISDKINLDSQQKADCDCLSMILPIYKPANNSKKSANVGFKGEVYGWVFLNVSLKDAFEQTVGSNSNPAIRYSLYKGLKEDQANLLYQNASDNRDYKGAFKGFVAKQPIKTHGQEWTLFAYSLPPFEKNLNYKQSTTIGFLGLLVSIALTGISFLAIARMRALYSLKHINKRLKFSDDRWRFALEGSGDGVWDWDVENNVVIYSKRWKEMLGYEESEVDGTPEEWQSKVHADDYSNVMKALNASLQDGSGNYSIECRLKCKDGSWKWVLSRGMVVSRDTLGNPLRMVGTNADISQLKESEEMIWQHANFDALTGLPNRRMLYARLEQELQKSNRSRTKLALLFFDLDNFKEVNDTLGHDQGDVLLQVAAERLGKILYKQDVVARLGGDEFVILISDIETAKLNQLDIVAQKVLSALAEPFVLNNQKVFVSASIGIAVYPDDSATIDDLLKSVDQAMYASKSRGGNCFSYFTSKMQEEAVNRLHLSNDLRVALRQNELFIEYQPIIELSTSRIFKAEALLRWQHPEKGFISPAEFIPIAENTRLINEIGGWVFKECIKQCTVWRQIIDDKFQISVNKSPVQFSDDNQNNGNWIQALSEHAKLESAIVVEITEGLLLDASGQVEARLKEYKDNGVQVALDDFGTGYSSLSYLRKFDIDYLKIDQAFVANLEASNEDRLLCRAIISMAHSLGIKVIAEGIETKEQQDILVIAGCDYGQGYYFSRSLPPDQFETYVKKTA